MFLPVPAYPGYPGQTAVKWLLLLLYVGRAAIDRCLLPAGPQQQTCSSGFAGVDPYWDRRTDRQRTPVSLHTPCSGGPSHADFMLIYANGARCRTVGGVTKTVVTESRRDADGKVTTTTTETTSTDDDVRTTITAAVATICGPIYKIAYDLS